jgi:CBS domain containing-hemolysin-like protein
MQYKNLKMTVDAADKRRILRVKIEIEEDVQQSEADNLP